MLRTGINSPDPLSEGTPPSFDLRPAAVQTWVADLPLADVSKTCALVFNALAETNGRSLPSPHRFKLLEAMRDPVHYLEGALSRQFTATGLPLPPQAGKAASLLHGLQLEIASGYRQIAEELLGLEGLRQDFVLLASAAQRALIYYGRALLTDYQAYRPTAPGLWHGVHTLFEGAERKGVTRSRVKDPHSPNEGVSTVETEYLQILLLALADPLRLAQGDMERLARLLAPWASHCRLSPLARPDVPAGACIVDLRSDRPPVQHRAFGTAPPIRPTLRWLDTSALLAELQRLATHPPPEIVGPRLPRGEEAVWLRLLDHLRTAWGGGVRRMFTRNEGILEEMQWVAGLTGSHRVLTEEESNKPVELPFAFGRDTPRSLQRRGRADQPVHVAMILNESANGVRLRWVDTVPGRVRVDEVLVLRHAHQPGWGAGAVRWIKSLSQRGLELGVELVAPEVMPIMVRRRVEGGDEREHLKALYLPAVAVLRQPASLLLPASFFQAGDTVSVQIERRTQALRLERAVESNRIYARFLFSSAE